MPIFMIAFSTKPLHEAWAKTLQPPQILAGLMY